MLVHFHVVLRILANFHVITKIIVMKINFHLKSSFLKIFMLQKFGALWYYTLLILHMRSFLLHSYIV